MTNLEMEEKINQARELNRQITALNGRIESVPQVEQQYAELLRQYEQQYAELRRQYERAKEQFADSSTAGPSLLSRTDPESAGIQGKVELAVTIGTDGIARDVQVLRSPDPALNKKAIECVATWRFQPAMRNGQAVTAFASVEVTFK